MKKERFEIDNIPCILWGEKSNKIYIAIHGNMSHKEDTVIEILAKKVLSLGYQMLSFDLPDHGERKDRGEICKAQNSVEDLKKIITYAKTRYEDISIFACSMGAYFSLLAYKDEKISNAIFLSPVVDMLGLINRMMMYSGVSYEMLEEAKEIATPFGQVLYLDYYNYVRENLILNWNIHTNILYGSLDNMQTINEVQNFADRFNTGLEVLEGGEHYFHTDSQLKFFENWLEKVIVKEK